MTSHEKEMILGKLQELVEQVKRLPVHEEVNLFNQEVEMPVLPPTSFTPSKSARARIKDGSMTAKMISHRLTKESGRPVSRNQVTKVAKSIGADSYYKGSQHERRYTPESVSMIITLFRSIL